jgi:hypothetical protein
MEASSTSLGSRKAGIPEASMPPATWALWNTVTWYPRWRSSKAQASPAGADPITAALSTRSSRGLGRS